MDEQQFRQWYAAMARKHDLNPDPDSPDQFYDYRAAFRANAKPDETGHWPSDFKKPGHPALVVGGFHVQTGERVPGAPRAKDAAELVRLGWDRHTAQRLAAMPEPQSSEVVIVDASGQEHVFPAGFDPKKAAAIVRGQSAPAQSTAQQKTGGGALQTAKDFGIGVLKGAGSTLAGIGEMAVNAGAIPGMARGATFNSAMRHPAFRRSDEATTASNPTQRVGKVTEAVAEFAIPAGAVANAVPRVARAGKNFQKVMGAARRVPVDIEAPGQAALRIQQLAERGGTEPRAVSKLLRRMTDPSKAPMEFEEGRDFYSNISRLSADEYGRLTPVMQREVGNLREALNRSLQQSAETVGQGDRYAKAMKEYAQAAKLGSYRKTLVDALLKGAVPVAGATGAAYWLGNKLRAGVTGGDPDY